MFGIRRKNKEKPKLDAEGESESNAKREPKSNAELCASVDKTRSRSGLGALVAGDIAIAGAIIAFILLMPKGSGTSSQIVAILGGGFTAIGTMTTAYFGIKSISNATSNIADKLNDQRRSADQDKQQK